jgi:hypothetical protein
MSVEAIALAITALIVVASICWVAVSVLRRRSLRNAGYGIAALRSLDLGQRDVSAKIVRVPDLAHSWGAGKLVEHAFTVVTIPHSGHVANAVTYRGSNAKDVNDESLNLLIPEWRVASSGTKAEIDLNELNFVRGFVAVEPEQIRFVEAGDLLEPDYLREVVEKLVSVSERLERGPVLARPAV